jgi:putative pyruvate formate lyase activating enzyme
MASERGVCGLGSDALVAEHFVHIGEEAPINPSVIVSLVGCGLRCRFCQQWRLLSPKSARGSTLSPELWAELEVDGAQSLSFVGGNPDESVYQILRFLSAAPDSWSLPIVWNSHAYSTQEVLALLDGVVDAYLPDLKYSNEGCARRLSRIPNYPETAQHSIATMLQQDVPVIVRILVLPEHNRCCHVPALDFLGGVASKEKLYVSLRGQYFPDWQIREGSGPLGRRPATWEMDELQRHAGQLDLTLIS